MIFRTNPNVFIQVKLLLGINKKLSLLRAGAFGLSHYFEAYCRVRQVDLKVTLPGMSTSRLSFSISSLYHIIKIGDNASPVF